jgi:hypothetical protein
LNITIQSPIKIYWDNQAACHIAINPVFHEWTKYVEVDCHFIREKIKDREIEAPFVRIKYQFVNIFTKGLERIPFEINSSKLELIDIYNSNLRVLKLLIMREIIFWASE